MRHWAELKIICLSEKFLNLMDLEYRIFTHLGKISDFSSFREAKVLWQSADTFQTANHFVILLKDYKFPLRSWQAKGNSQLFKTYLVRTCGIDHREIISKLSGTSERQTAIGLMLAGALILSFLIRQIQAFRCYSCASTLPANTSSEAKLAFKTILYSNYAVPPVSKFCFDSNDVEFQTVPRVFCSSDDQCVKITVSEKG